MDTSRVALAISRQRLLTAKYEFYNLRDENAGVAGGFKYSSIPYISFGSIARNANLDPILTRHESILATKLAGCNGRSPRSHLKFGVGWK